MLIFFVLIFFKRNNFGYIHQITIHTVIVLIIFIAAFVCTFKLSRIFSSSIFRIFLLSSFYGSKHISRQKGVSLCPIQIHDEKENLFNNHGFHFHYSAHYNLKIFVPFFYISGGFGFFSLLSSRILMYFL